MKRRILKEFRNTNAPSLESLVSGFSKSTKLSKVGGPDRVYSVVGGEKGVIYTIGMTMSAIGFTWKKSPAEVSTVYFWDEFNIDREPDYAVDLPMEADVAVLVPALVKMIKSKTMGEVSL